MMTIIIINSTCARRERRTMARPSLSGHSAARAPLESFEVPQDRRRDNVGCLAERGAGQTMRQTGAS